MGFESIKFSDFSINNRFNTDFGVKPLSPDFSFSKQSFGFSGTNTSLPFLLGGKVPSFTNYSISDSFGLPSLGFGSNGVSFGAFLNPNAGFKSYGVPVDNGLNTGFGYYGVTPSFSKNLSMPSYSSYAPSLDNFSYLSNSSGFSYAPNFAGFSYSSNRSGRSFNSNWGNAIAKTFNVQGIGTNKGDAFFDTALDYIFEREGGYANVKYDKGGETNMGITKATYHDWLKGKGRPIKSVKDITKAEARQIYYEVFWKPLGCDKLPSKVALLVFDIGVNSGVGVGKEYVKHYKNGKSMNELLAMRQRQYESYIANDPTQAGFRKGWLNRLDELEDKMCVV